MNSTPVGDIAFWTKGALQAGATNRIVERVCTDSRSLQPGDFFVPLRGENFDGHKYLAVAAAQGAVGAFADCDVEGLPPDFALIRVADTLKALQDMAGAYRGTLSLQAVCLTGSNGKTSTKDITAKLLGQQFRVCKTEGNLNNHIGLPMSVLRATSEEKAAVWELGMNHAGEIAPLAKIAAPDVAIITNIGVAHIEYMGSREAIAQEKGMLVEALQPSGTAVLNADDEFSRSLAARTKADTIYCGLEKGEIRASEIVPGIGGTRFMLHGFGRSVAAELPIPGIHMVRNALLAVGAAHVLGVPLEVCAEGLAALRLTGGRMEWKSVRGLQCLDDSYNANPDSVEAAIIALGSMPCSGQRIAVLGRMGELGSEAENGHRRVGRAAAQEKLDVVIAVLGISEDPRWIAEEAAAGGVKEVLVVASHAEAAGAVVRLATPDDLILVKGSRSARMEQILKELAAI